ncbi:uncharacterized protein LOC119315139 [Triticum dicoccoides]|uniref:uncharacterized protein LOC119315139 n=1 Tax=Triticum dicoccoides TaxID=85692 RepID=UPI000E7BBCAD|nr:uncharacterized protein LOC119315139 [Triticum dicoccoides]
MTMKMISKSPLLNLLRMILVMTTPFMMIVLVVILMGVAMVLMTMLIIPREFLHQAQPVAEGDCDKSNEPELGQQFHAGSVDIFEGKQVGFDCQGGVSVTIEGGLEVKDRASDDSSRFVADNVDCGPGLLDARQAPEGACAGVFVMDGLGDDVNHAASFEGKQVLKDTAMPESIGAGGDVFYIPVCKVLVVDGARASNKDAKPAVVLNF